MTKITQIPIEKLVEHPANANEMTKANLTKLIRNIERNQHYEPLVVRPHPKRPGNYQLINGHHRKKAIRHLGYELADCIVWEVSDDETLVLLASLNTLCGRDRPEKRADLLEKLSEKFQIETLLKRLPETRKQLQKRLECNKTPQIIGPENLPEMPQAMTFFVTKQQKNIVEETLKLMEKQTAGDTGGERLSRGDLLAAMANRILQEGEPLQ